MDTILPPGLIILPRFITPKDEKSLIASIENEEWQEWSTPSTTGTGRKLQQFGYTYNHIGKNKGKKIAPKIPKILNDIGERLAQYHEDQVPDQVIINQYIGKQGIGKHTDNIDVFGPVVTTISLGGEAEMIFRSKREIISVPLYPRSAVIMTEDARYEWTHEIPIKLKYNMEGEGKHRDDSWSRISVTFRNMKD